MHELKTPLAKRAGCHADAAVEGAERVELAVLREMGLATTIRPHPVLQERRELERPDIWKVHPASLGKEALRLAGRAPWWIAPLSMLLMPLTVGPVLFVSRRRRRKDVTS